MATKDLEKQRKYRRDWYYRNKDRQAQYKKQRDAEMRDWYLSLKEVLACAECGENHPAVLEFHHTDPTKKDMAVSAAVLTNGWSKKRVLEEIEKCVVLCKNCHAIEHWNERQQIG